MHDSERSRHGLRITVFFGVIVTEALSAVTYTAINSHQTWAAAKQGCENIDGASLAMIKDIISILEARQKFIEYQVPYEYWVGVRYDPSTTDFLWADGSDVPSTPEFEAIVDRAEMTAYASERCMYIDATHYKLLHTSCTFHDHKKYMCQSGQEELPLDVSSSVPSMMSSPLKTSSLFHTSSLEKTLVMSSSPRTSSLKELPITFSSIKSSKSSRSTSSLPTSSVQFASSLDSSSIPLTSSSLPPVVKVLPHLTTISKTASFLITSSQLPFSIPSTRELVNVRFATESQCASTANPTQSLITPASSASWRLPNVDFARLIRVHEYQLNQLNVGDASSLEFALNLTSQLLKDANEIDTSSVTTGVLVIGAALEKFGMRYARYHLTAGNGTQGFVSIGKQNIAMSIMRIPADYQNDVTFPRVSAGFDETFIIEENEAVRLPAQLFAGQERYGACMLYKDAAMMTGSTLTDGSDRTIISMSRVVACSLSPHISGRLEHNVTIRLSQRQKMAKQAIPTCVYWSFSNRTKPGGSWSSNGCSMVEASNKQTTCSCNHLTNFAVLMEVGKTEISDENKLALKIITFVGCSLSLIGESVTILAYLLLMDLTLVQIQIRLNMVACLAFAQLVFMTGIEAITNKALCISIAIVINYCYLVAFAWMVMEGIMLYLKLVRVFNVNANMRYFYGFAWGLPTFLVAIAVSTNILVTGGMESAMRTDVCWFSFSSGFIWSFVGPILLACLINFVVLVRIIVEMVKLKDMSNSSQVPSLRQSVKACVVLFPSLGLAWIFGVFVVTQSGIIFQYLFVILNSLQGFFIFVFHVIRSEEIKAAFLSKKYRWNVSRSVSVSVDKVDKRLASIAWDRSEKRTRHLELFNNRGKVVPSSAVVDDNLTY